MFRVQNIFLPISPIVTLLRIEIEVMVPVYMNYWGSELVLVMLISSYKIKFAFIFISHSE